MHHKFTVFVVRTGHSGAVVAYWTGDLKVPGSTPSPGLGTLNQVPGLQSLRKTIVVIKKGRKTPVHLHFIIERDEKTSPPSVPRAPGYRRAWKTLH